MMEMIGVMGITEYDDVLRSEAGKAFGFGQKDVIITRYISTGRNMKWE